MHPPNDQTDFYYRNARLEMLPYVPSDIRTALDIGCGLGVFGTLLIQRYQAEVWGIEARPEIAKGAEQVLHKVLCGDAHSLIRELPATYFDVVICNDVLEHLANPYQVLRDLMRVITPGARLVCSIPNIRYYEALKEIFLEKDFRYRKDGIFDVTHLRFFTHKSICRMFAELDYVLERIEGINPIQSAEFERMNQLFGGSLEDCRYLQFACVARKSSPGSEVR